MPKLRGPKLRRLLCCAVLVTLAGCNGSEENVTDFIQRIKREQHGEVETIPEIQKYESYTYQAQGIKSPFEPSSTLLAFRELLEGEGAARPDADRSRGALESLPIDSFTMVGTLQRGDDMWGLVLDRKGLIHKVKPGDYIGQNSGKIDEVTASSIYVTEMVADGQGGWIERTVTLTLSE